MIELRIHARRLSWSSIEPFIQLIAMGKI